MILASSEQDCGVSIYPGIPSGWALVTLTTGEGTMSKWGMDITFRLNSN